MRSPGPRRPAALVAAGLAFASAALSAYWVLGGTALLDTVGGYAEELARTRSPLALLVGLLVVAAKIAAGVLALALTRPVRRGPVRRLLVAAGGLGGALLAAYGGLLVAVGALVLAGVVRPETPVDRRALTWHVAVWDLWFLLWGLALALAAWHFRRTPPVARPGQGGGT
jgi:hypothetical protein